MSLHFKFDLRLRVLGSGLGQEYWNDGIVEFGKLEKWVCVMQKHRASINRIIFSKL